MAADGGGVEAGVDAGEEDDEVFGDEIRDALVVRGEELGLGGFPGVGNWGFIESPPARLCCFLVCRRRLRGETCDGVAEEGILARAYLRASAGGVAGAHLTAGMNPAARLRELARCGDWLAGGSGRVL